MRRTTITVDDLRYAIQDLPGSASVLVKSEHEWGTRELSEATGAHDGRYGPVLLIVLGGYVSPFNAAGVKDEQTEPEAG